MLPPHIERFFALTGLYVSMDVVAFYFSFFVVACCAWLMFKVFSWINFV